MSASSLAVLLCAIFVCGCDPGPNASPSSSPGYVVAVEDVHTDERTVTGYVRNLTGHPGWFKIQFTLYDSSGAVIGKASDRFEGGLGQGSRWKFKANVWDRDVSTYLFEGVWCKYGQISASYETRAEAEKKEERAYVARKAADEARAALVKSQETPEAIQERVAREAEANAEAEQKRARLEEQRTRPAREQLARVLVHQHTQASNGYPSFQLELGKRYLRGEGVLASPLLARHWLSAACTNGLSEATNLLAKIP